MSSGGGGKSKSKESSSQQVNVPDWLRPYVNQSLSTGMDALRNFQGQASGNLVAGFDPAQVQAQQQAMDVANGVGGYLPAAQQTFLDTAMGQNISSFLPQDAYGALAGLAGGGSMNPVSQSGVNALQSAAQTGAPQAALDALQGNFNADSMPAEARQALSDTASGAHLYGGDGFNAALDASMRRITPQIQSTFNRAGPGGASSGLAQQAIAQANADAFAGLYGQERSNQIGAANALSGYGLQQQGQNQNAASQFANSYLSGNAQKIGAGNALAGLGDSMAGRQLQAGGLLAGYGDAERNRQLQAAGQLPGMALAGANILGDVGSQRQGLAQQQIDAPMTANQILAQMAYGGFPSYASMFGQSGNRSGTQSGLNFSWGG